MAHAGCEERRAGAGQGARRRWAVCGPLALLCAPVPVFEQRSSIFLDEYEDVALNVIGLGGQERQQGLRCGEGAVRGVRASGGAQPPQKEATRYVFEDGGKAAGGKVGNAA